jgi:hypothetical protein
MLQSEQFTIVRELRELTGESDRQLYAWAKQHLAGKDVLGVEQTFKTRLRTDWLPSTRGTNTCDCRLESRPLHCEIRLRATSLITQFRRDVQRKKNRQLVILWGYEICTQLLHYRIYRGPEFGIGDDLAICDEVRPATLAAFAKECATLVGLPIKQLLLTQPLLELPETKENEVVYLGLDDGSLAAKDSKALPSVNTVPIASALVDADDPDTLELTPLDGLDTVQAWCGGSNAARLAERLEKLVRDHNQDPDLTMRVKMARKQLERLFDESHKRMTSSSSEYTSADLSTNRGDTSADGAKPKRRGKRYSVKERPETPFIKRYGNHLYLEPEERRSLRRLLARRTFEDFRNAVSDMPKRADALGDSGDTATAP